MNPTQLLVRVRELFTLGQEDAAVDQLFATFLEWFEAGYRGLADEYMELSPLRDLNPTLMIAPLTITYPMRRLLSSRDDYYNRVRDRLLEIEPDRVDHLLAGLEDV